MKCGNILAIGALAVILAGARLGSAETVRLEDLDLAGMSAGWGKPQKNQSVTETPLSIGGERFERGVGTHANSECWITLDGQAKSFRAQVGVDDNANSDGASIEFWVFGDGRELWHSGVCKWRDKPARVPRRAGGHQGLGVGGDGRRRHRRFRPRRLGRRGLRVRWRRATMGLPAASAEEAVAADAARTRRTPHQRSDRVRRSSRLPFHLPDSRHRPPANDFRRRWLAGGSDVGRSVRDHHRPDRRRGNVPREANGDERRPAPRSAVFGSRSATSSR